MAPSISDLDLLGSEKDTTAPILPKLQVRSSVSPTSHTTSSRSLSGGRLRGKTVDGQSFLLPSTKNVFASVFGGLFRSASKERPISVFDMAVLSVLVLHIALFFATRLPSVVYLLLFLFWRASYNLGLGWLLKLQSERKTLVAVISPYLDSKVHPKVASFLKMELSKKLDADYRFSSVPVEFNAWIIFRSFVDLILIHDFTSYIMFTLAFWEIPSSFGITDFLRIFAGTMILLFNLWVKMDAHRVVKDFAWYWGDFFFLLDNPLLTFDGVFEMAPHPMYSVGYAGYYGMALITGSYSVLYVSLLAHLGQFMFLTFVENPHISKTYGQDRYLPDHIFSNPESGRVFRSYFSRNLNILFFKNWDIYRTSDLFSLVISVYAVLAGMLGTPAFAAGQAVAWIVFHTYVLGYILHKQSTCKMWTRHFIKFGHDNHRAFEHWKAAYNLSIGMLYVTFGIAALRHYAVPDAEHAQGALFRHVLGLLLLGLHVWTSHAIYEVLGDFGFFYGDFFIDEIPVTLFYTGIYRFIHNPEKIMGHAAFWGITLMSGSWVLFGITLFSQISNFCFIRFVEQPHMASLYGDAVRPEAGWERAVKKVSVPAQWVEPVHDTLGQLTSRVSEFFLVHLSPTSPALRERLDIYQITSPPGPVPWPAPCVLHVQLPAHHGRRDWVGVYPVTRDLDVAAPLSTTRCASNGRWKYWTNAQAPPPLDTDVAHEATLRTLSFDLLTPGTYEARLHYDDSHKVLAVTRIEIAPPHSLAQVLAHVLGETHVRQPWDTAQAKKVAEIVSAVYQVEFHHEVIAQFADLETLETKIREALNTLYPPLRSRSRSTTSFLQPELQS